MISLMPNIATIFKEEISRLARKELRGESAALKKASAQYRSDIAALKRQVQSLERQVAKLMKSSPKEEVKQSESVEGRATRFSAKRLLAHRTRLGLSAAEMGVLLAASGQSIYKWEQGKTRPRANHMPAIAALRTLKKDSAAAVIAAATAGSKT